jgi:signal transduction histidine kinase
MEETTGDTPILPEENGASSRPWVVRYPPDPLDLLFGVVLSVIIVAQVIGAHESIRALFGLLAGLPLAYRRRWPLAVFGIVLVGVVVVGSATNDTFYPAIIAGVIATYSLGAYGKRPLLSAGVLLATGTAIFLKFGGQVPPPPDFLTPYLILMLPWLVGMVLRDRQLKANAYRDKAERLEQEQERAREAARAEERDRIARELHDVVAHSVSIMVVQAGAARQVLRTSPDQATEALLIVEETGREAMTELRNMLGVLSLEGEVDLAPQPGLEQIPSLVKRVEEAGLPVELHIGGAQRSLPAGVDLAAYRIVQEALTNALKYSGPAHTEVSLDYRADALKIEVVDDGAGGTRSGESGMRNDAGRGLTGMRERVAMYGGSLEAGPRLLGRGYAVRAWLPLNGAPANGWVGITTQSKDTYRPPEPGGQSNGTERLT